MGLIVFRLCQMSRGGIEPPTYGLRGGRRQFLEGESFQALPNQAVGAQLFEPVEACGRWRNFTATNSATT